MKNTTVNFKKGHKHEYGGDDRCTCGAMEVWLDHDGRYGCDIESKPWADPIRSLFGDRSARIVKAYADRYGMPVAQARAEMLDDIELARLSGTVDDLVTGAMQF